MGELETFLASEHIDKNPICEIYNPNNHKNQ